MVKIVRLNFYVNKCICMLFNVKVIFRILKYKIKYSKNLKVGIKRGLFKI